MFGTGEKTLLQARSKTLYQIYEIQPQRDKPTIFKPIYWEINYYDKRSDSWQRTDRFYSSKEARSAYRLI
jgi:hypothetical protein